jgi:hypothetical protein
LLRNTRRLKSSEGSRPVEAAHEQPQVEECSLVCVRHDSNFFRSHCDNVLRDSVKRAHRFDVAGIETTT